jgi:Cu/Zn superoxide dismutase
LQLCTRIEASRVRISEHTQASDSRGDTLRRITKAALGGVAGCALVLGGTQAASGVLSEFFREQSENLLVDSGGPFDYAKATLEIAVDVEGDRTTFNLDLTKIDPSQLDPSQPDQKVVLGSHLHTGPCVEETGASAGPHYNHEVVTKNKSFPTGEKTYGYTAEVSPNTEVWFDLELTAASTTASDQTTVPFVPVDPDGIMSVVVHIRGTNTAYGVPFPGKVAGDAGTRQACFPVSSVSGIFPATVTK